MVDSPQNDCKATSGQKAVGLSIAAVVTWFLITARITAPLFGDWLSPSGTVATSLSQVINTLLLAAIFGFPISLLACFVVGYPAWVIAERFGMRTVVHAAIVGTLVATIIEAVWIAWQVMTVGSGNYASYGGVVMIDDGTHTRAWWMQEMNWFAQIVGIGAIVGAVTLVVVRKRSRAAE